MDVLRVYLDTSVIGGYFDPEFERDTRALIEHIHAGRIRAVLSKIVVDEIDRAPIPVQDVFDALLGTGAELLQPGPAELALQDAYIAHGVLSAKWADDAMHVALATIARVDALATWNFKHMIAPRRSRQFSEVNVTMGRHVVTIMSPHEILQTLETTHED